LGGEGNVVGLGLRHGILGKGNTASKNACHGHYQGRQQLFPGEGGR
jgi:hypothetical protein